MAKYRMECGTMVDTDKAKASWGEATRWNGNNRISVNTGSQWMHEALCLSAKGRYYLVCWSQWQGSTPSAHFIEPEEAAAWLMLNEEALPIDLQQYADSVSE